MDDIDKWVYKYIEKYDLIWFDDKLFVVVFGGLDFLVLLYFLWNLNLVLKEVIFVVYLNYYLRENVVNE